jgi:hypothetical protein
VANWWDPAVSLDKESPTLIMNAATGELVQHFVELDETTEGDHGRNALMLVPTQQLDPSSRYIVSIRNMVTSAGQLIAPSEAFQVLRDGLPAASDQVEARRNNIDDVISTLGEFGMTTNDLQIAWDFQTASVEGTTGQITHVREDAFARLPEAGPEYVIDSIRDWDDEDDYDYKRKIEATMTIPHYMTNNARYA